VGEAERVCGGEESEAVRKFFEGLGEPGIGMVGLGGGEVVQPCDLGGAVGVGGGAEEVDFFEESVEERELVSGRNWGLGLGGYFCSWCFSLRTMAVEVEGGCLQGVLISSSLAPPRVSTFSSTRASVRRS